MSQHIWHFKVKHTFEHVEIPLGALPSVSIACQEIVDQRLDLLANIITIALLLCNKSHLMSMTWQFICSRAFDNPMKVISESRIVWVQATKPFLGDSRLKPYPKDISRRLGHEANEPYLGRIISKRWFTNVAWRLCPITIAVASHTDSWLSFGKRRFWQGRLVAVIRLSLQVIVEMHCIAQKGPLITFACDRHLMHALHLFDLVYEKLPYKIEYCRVRHMLCAWNSFPSCSPGSIHLMSTSDNCENLWRWGASRTFLLWEIPPHLLLSLQRPMVGGLLTIFLPHAPLLASS